MKESNPQKVDELPISKEAMERMVQQEQSEEGDQKGDQTKEEQSKEQTDAEQKRARKNNRVLLYTIAGVILLLLILLFIRPLLPSENPKEVVTYNGYEFTKPEGDIMWYTPWQRGDVSMIIPFRNNPYQVQNITVQGTINDSFDKGVVFLTHDPGLDNLSFVAIAAANTREAFVKAFDILPVAACTKNETTACFDRDIITCDNKTQAVIYFKQANETKIIFDDNCITIQGKEYELLRATDRLLLQWFRIL